MKKVFIFLIAVGVNFSIDFNSIPKSLLTSTAYFGSYSNQGLPSAFLDCGNDSFQVLSVDLTFQTTGKVDVCKNSSAIGACSVAGDTTTSTAIDISQYDEVFLGLNNGSYKASELTTFTKIDGSFVAHRNCVSKDYLK